MSLSLRRFLCALQVLILLAAGCLPPRPAAAAVPNWGERPYVLVTVEQDLREVLRDFAAQLGLTLQMSEKVTGTVRGRLPAAPPVQFLDQLARTYGLLWYWDGFILWVYSIEESQSEMVKLQTANTQQLADTLAELDIWDGRFPIRSSPSSSLLYVTGPPRYVALVTDAAGKLDSNRQISIDFRVFPLRYASADDRVFTVRDQQVTVPGVATILRRLIDTGGFDQGIGTSRQPTSTVTTLFADPVFPYAASGGGGPRLLAGGPGGVGEDSPASGSGTFRDREDEPRIQADPRLNAVVVRDLSDRLPIYARLIEQLDRRQPLIELEVVIADVQSDKLVDLGVDWRFSVNDNDAIIGVGNPAALALSQGLTFSTAITGNPLSVLARIRALETRGEARVLSRPAVLTFDNVEAVFDKSENFFIRLEGNEAVGLQQVTTGLLVRVTPRLVDEGGRRPKVQMTIDVQDGQVLPATFQVDGLPSTENTTISTQGIVAERQGLVIGGFYRERQLDNLDKVPGLSEIPILGWALFQNRTRERSSLTRLFMIRPIVVPEPESRAALSGSIPRDGPPVDLFRPESSLALTPGRAMDLDQIRFGTLLGERVLGRAERTLCLARAELGAACEAGAMPPLDVDLFPYSDSSAAAAAAAAAPTPMPSLY